MEASKDGGLARGMLTPRVVTGVVAGVLGLLTLAATLAAFAVTETAATDRLDRRATSALEAIDRRMQAYTESVFGGRSLFTADTPSRVEYRSYVAALGLTSRYPGIQVLGHASLVDHDDRPAYDAAVQADADAADYPEFVPYPEGVREDYVIIDYVEPTVGNEAAFGLDFFSEPNRRAAVERSRDTGMVSTTAPIVLVQETGQQSGFLVMLPIYDDLDGVDEAARREAFVGVEYAAFRMGDLVEGVLGTSRDARLEVYDVGTPEDAGAPTRENQTYGDDDLSVAADGDIDPATARLLDYDIGGRRWVVLYEATVPLSTTFEALTPWALLVGGLLITAMAAAGVWAMTTSRARAVALAERMTADLRESREELARSNLELERFAYVASHDLQEPLRTVSSFVGLLQMRYGHDLDDEARTYIGYAREGAERMSTLISELLEFSRAGRDHVLEPVDLARSWRTAIAGLRATIEEAGASVSAGPLPTVLAEEAGATQVLQNLVGNAIKYRHPERPCVITASASREGDAWRIEVTDNGIGIDPEYHEEIFVMLRRLHTRQEYPGTGMGLAISKKHVEAAGGDIGVASTPGQGSTFWFTLRPAPAGDEPHGASGAAAGVQDHVPADVDTPAPATVAAEVHRIHNEPTESSQTPHAT